MPLYEGSHGTTVRAAAEEAFAVMTDYDSLPDWQRPLKRCTVLSRYEDGLAREVEYEVDVKLRRVRYTLRHEYDEPREIGSEYIDGDFKCFEGRWRFDPAGDGVTRLRFDLRIDPGLPVPARFQRMLHERVLRSAVEDLRKRLEAGAS
jgi:ribosome-associated toxin RatA of RatAB toxin-antitoxin module